MKITLFMVISPGERHIAGDTLQRARNHLPTGWPSPSLVIARNTPDSLPPLDAAQWDDIVSHNVPGAPRPYFEIARTIAKTLLLAAKTDGELLIKIDPDTMVCSSAFFTDLARLHQATPGDFYAWMTRYRGLRNNLGRILRLLADCLPVGLSRRHGGDRYGQRLTFRLGRAWHASATLRAMLRGCLPVRQPSGGGYAVSVLWLRSKMFQSWASANGPNGLEWNDDTLLPIAIRAAGGRIVDLRETPMAPGWRWMHGSRYFTLAQAAEPGLRALHPLKDNPDDWAVRHSLPCPPPEANHT